MIEQALYGSQDTGGYRFLARSPGFRDEWLTDAERFCTGFGERPSGVACSSSLFALPFGSRHVAIIRVADQGHDDTGRPGALGFYLLIVPRSLYVELGGDPFHIAEQFPPPWSARDDLPTLTWNGPAPPPRTVAMLQKTLNVPQSATLLGGVQILLDGGKLVFERSSPDAAILRSLWALLPTRERCELWPASFTFSNVHQFDVVVVPRATGPEFEAYITEEKAGDYPEGRYECNLQSAIETGDQQEVDALLNYSRSRMLRLIVLLFVMVLMLTVAMSKLLDKPPPFSPAATGTKQPVLDLPPVAECPRLSQRERMDLSKRMSKLAERLHVTVPVDASEDGLTTALTELDRQLGSQATRKDDKPLRDYGPVQRQIRVLLWKHGVPAYNQRGLNNVELLERLEEKLDAEHR
jgi:hypothetical protein